MPKLKQNRRMRWTLTLFIQVLLISVAVQFFAVQARAKAPGLLCEDGNHCPARGALTNKAVGATKSDTIRLNPASVPVEEITGIESIYYDSSFSLGLVKGLGRVGAAISPTNNEETFFGPPAIEGDQEYYERMLALKKYDSPKYTLATAFQLYAKEGDGFNHRYLALGVMARYNGTTEHLHPGVGLQAIVGFVNLGASIYEDDLLVTPSQGPSSTSTKYQTSTYSLGLVFESLSLDYSVLQVSGGISTTSVVTASGFIGRTILTVSRRQVESSKPRYDFELRSLVNEKQKAEYFAGVQYRLAPWLVLGAFYNYYLLHEPSVGITVFF